MNETIRLATITSLVLAILLAACALDTPIPEPDSPDAIVYRQQCSGCHALPHPRRHTAAQWKHMMLVMDHVREERSVAPLTPEQRDQILGYLEANAR